MPGAFFVLMWAALAVASLVMSYRQLQDFSALEDGRSRMNALLGVGTYFLLAMGAGYYAVASLVSTVG